MLTRSVHGTYCLLDGKKNKPNKRIKNEADWIRESVSGSVERDEELGVFSGRLIYEHGSWGWLETIPVNAQAKPKIDTKLKLLPVEKRKENVIAGDDKARQFAKTIMDRGGQKYGNLMHQCFESIEWWEGKLKWNKNGAVREHVLECMNSASFKAFFEARKGLKVYREQSVDSMLCGIWVSGVIDRLLVDCDDSGKVMNAVVVDFKTDDVEDPSDLIDRYRDQLDRYRKIISQTYSLNEENVYAVILSTHFKKIINL